MSKGKKIYIVILLLITVLVTTFYFSYAIFSNTKEEHGKLNIVAGTLNYKIESSSLDSDSIMIIANTSKEIKIKLTSLNEVSSKYELYYVLDKVNENVSVGYSKDTKDNVVGTIDANKSKVITIVIRNDSNTDSKISFKVIGGLINNELALNDGNSLNQEVSLCRYEVGYVWNFDYTGSEQEFTTPCSGNYKLETWGAQGAQGGSNRGTGGYNGGGAACGYKDKLTSSGGGATHISDISGLLLNLEDKKDNILIVSGGGGGAGYQASSGNGTGGSGGGFKGNSGGYNTNYQNLYIFNGATQSSGGPFIQYGNYTYYDSSFGQGGGAKSNNGNASGGGGGFYGGGPGNLFMGAGGGSGYIGNNSLYNKAMYCYNCEESSEESTKTISTTCVSDTPTSNCSKQGSGYARITYLGK